MKSTASEPGLKDTTDFINFIEKTRVVENAILVSMDVTSLYTNIPQEEGITIICKAYETFYQNKPPIPSQYLADMLRLILRENFFNLLEKTTSKYKVQLWEQKWQLHFLTFLCLQ